MDVETAEPPGSPSPTIAEVYAAHRLPLVRADQVTAESLSPQRPVEASVTRLRPRRFRRTAALFAAAASVVVVIGIGAVVRGLPERPGSSVSTAVSFEGVSLTVPGGWVFREVAEGTACVQPVGSPRPDGECTPYGIEIRVGGSSQWPGDVVDRDDGWHNASYECRGVAHPEEFHSQVTGNRLTSRDERRVGDRVAAYREWRVTCDPDMAFTVRLWWQPDVPLVVVTRALDLRHDATVDAFVANVRA